VHAVRRLARTVATLAAACAAVALLPAPAHAAYSVSLASGRRYSISVEQRGTLGTTSPNVVLLHGMYNSSATLAAQTGFDHVGTSMGWTIVYGESPTKTWNAGGCCSTAMSNGVDDVRYLLDVVVSLRRRGHYGPVYLAGFSNGGMLALRAGCEHPEVFRRVSSVAGTLVAPCSNGLAHVRHIHGTADTVVPYNGGYSTYCAVTFPAAYAETAGTTTLDYKLVSVSGLKHAWPPSATTYLRDFFATGTSSRAVVAGGYVVYG
jgi:poly(3-hydroxybutyrate) depolymerase